MTHQIKLNSWGKITPSATKALNSAAAILGLTIDTATPEQKNAIRSTLVNMTMEEAGMSLEKAFNMFWGDCAYEELKNSVAESIWNK